MKERLLKKAKEAFVMAIEIYNKPTIAYRVEGFSFFICNAWELMLKSHLIKTQGNSSIYYVDNPNRTISLENAIKKIFTNNKDPLRLNLEKIIELRNTSTHFITEEYEMVYISLFQSCLLNFNEKMYTFHKIDMTTVIPQNFLTLSISMKALNETEIMAKYPEEIATKLLDNNNDISTALESTNEKFAIKIEHHHFITKNKDIATSLINIDNTAKAGVKIIKELKDPNITHRYSTTNCIDEIKRRLEKQSIALKLNDENKAFTSNDFNLFVKYYGIKDKTSLCYHHQLANRYTYTIQAIDFIVEEIKKDPENIIQNLKTFVSKK